MKTNFILSLIIFLAAIQNFSQNQYELIYLGNNVGLAEDINNSGQIVGRADYPGNISKAFLWEDSVFTELGTLGGQNSIAYGINNFGKVVGMAQNASGFARAFIWQNGTITDLGTFGGNQSIAFDINNSGHVVGVADTIGFNNKRAFIFEGDSLRFLGTLGGYESWAYAINNSGQVVGSARDTDQVQRPFLWENGEMIALGNLYGGATDINSEDKIVGWYADPNGYAKAFLWENGSLTDLGTLGGNNSNAQSINDNNQVVGYSDDAMGNPKAFIWENGVMTDLNTLVSTGITLIGAQSINNLGQVISGVYLLIPGNIIAGISSPSLYAKWISGETHTIAWTGPNWNSVNIRCITNFETPLQNEIVIAQGVPIAQLSFEWNIPDNLFSYRSKIIVENAENIFENIESQIFRIKPYRITRVQNDSTYYAYDINNDRWGFGNDSADVWPDWWFNQFEYRGIDPISGHPYPQWEIDSLFYEAEKSDHPDWGSMVGTFGTEACYLNLADGIFSAAAMMEWESIKDEWGGSCFGFAIANALAFEKTEEFLNRYPNFPNFNLPINVGSNNNSIPVINGLFTHQFGNPHWFIYQNSLDKTPVQTINELKQMLIEDNTQIQTISFLNNNGSGGHAIFAYGLEKDESDPDVVDILVYDNSYPDDINAEIEVDTAFNIWGYSNWAAWGGEKWLFLEDIASSYLTNPGLNKNSSGNSPFILSDTVLQIFNPITASIQITDDQGNKTGFFNNTLTLEIPGANPFIVKNGSEWRPKGYALRNDNYSVELKEFAEDTVKAFFFTGNKSFSYERYEAEQNQSDRLFFDGGVSVSNPDAQTKTIKLLNLINETTQEKLFVVRSLNLVQNDSVKIENLDSNQIKLISYGSAKDYDIELNYTTETGVGRFGDFNIPLSANTSHTFIPEWTDLSNIELQVIVDIGNDGSIDDTLSLKNEVTGIKDEGSLLSPDSYNLAQNFPNPFNPVTIIQYSISQSGHVSLKVYDVLGNEVATLVNEEKNRGVYSIKFDASGLASGIYFYSIQAGSFNQVKKMLLIK